MITERADGLRGDARRPHRVGGGDAVSRTRRRDRPSRQPARRLGARRVGGQGAGARRTGSVDVGRSASPARSATSPDGSPATRVCVTTRAALTADGAAAGPIARACATPRSASTPRTTPGSPPRSTRPLLPSGPSPTTAAASTSSAPTRSWRWSTAPSVPAGRRHGRAARAHRPRDAAVRRPRLQRVRDVRRPTAPTGHRAAVGLRGRHHPGRVGRRWAGRRCRTSQTPRHRRPTTSTPRHVPDVRRTRLPRPLR